ncbi:centromere protein O isoform X2 [Manacus candei]|uniref:centromere protein O isoform X2 n=1 Tax=Manacus candei TaxID=415023 RepID=UPI00222651F6|nr:centromere protein O isoform X2 [Manacus candei]
MGQFPWELVNLGMRHFIWELGNLGITQVIRELGPNPHSQGSLGSSPSTNPCPSPFPGIPGKLSKHQSLSFPIPRDPWEALQAPIPVLPHSQGSLGSSPSTNPYPSPFPGIPGKLSKHQSLSFPVPRDLWEALQAPIPVLPHSQGSLGSSPSTNPHSQGSLGSSPSTNPHSQGSLGSSPSTNPHSQGSLGSSPGTNPCPSPFPGISGKLSKHQSLSFPIPRDLWEALPAPIPVHPHSQGSLGSSPSTNPCPSPFPGISGKLSKRGLCLTLSTSYEGSHLDSFHLELLLRPEVRIQRHSIPAFIPLEQLSRRFLATDLRRFLALLSQHLEGYSGRRFQADQLQSRLPPPRSAFPTGSKELRSGIPSATS